MSETVNYSNCDLQSMIVVIGDYDCVVGLVGPTPSKMTL